MDAVEIIAHRGSSFLAPENTLAAVELAWQEGADAVEGDFRLTADGHIVAVHDFTLQRTADIDRPVVQCSLEEIRTYDVGSWKGSQFSGQRVSTLEEMLATVPTGKRFFVEVKCDVEIVDSLRRAVENCGLMPEQIVPISLRLDVCSQIKRALPECPVYWVVDFKQDGMGGWKPTPNEMFREIELRTNWSIDGLDLMATGPIDAGLIQCIKSTWDKTVCVWTVDDPELARRLIEVGVGGITTNRPGWLREQLRL